MALRVPPQLEADAGDCVAELGPVDAELGFRSRPADGLAPKYVKGLFAPEAEWTTEIMLPTAAPPDKAELVAARARPQVLSSSPATVMVWAQCRRTRQPTRQHNPVDHHHWLCRPALALQEGRLRQELVGLRRYGLTIVDETSHIPFEHYVANLFYHLVS